LSATGSPATSHRNFRFGPFVLSERHAELRKNGVRVKLQEQPFQVLLELVANAGNIVSREELQQRLWPADTFVDFNVGVNTAIRKLRLALNDDADNPHYIETVSKRGYRFIAEVTVQLAITPVLLKENASGSVSLPPIVVVPQTETESAIAVAEATPSADATPVKVPRQETRRRKRAKEILAFGLLLFAVACGLLYYAARPYPIPTVKGYKQLSFDGGWKFLTGVDGARIYTVLYTPEYTGMAELSTAGGDLRKVPLLPTRTAVPEGISADGTQLLVIDPWPADRQPSPFYSVPILGGAPLRLGDAKGLGASWSSDRSLLAYHTVDTVYLANGDGSGSRKLITIPGVETLKQIGGVTISPNGGRIRFSAPPSPGKEAHLFEINSDGSGFHQLLPGFSAADEFEGVGVWSGDGRYFFFGAHGQMWVLPERRSFLSPQPKPVQLTSGAMVYSSFFLGTDHRNLYVTGFLPHGELVRYDLQSGLYAPVLGGISAEFASYSPDGQWVAYVTYPDGTLYRSKTDGSQRLPLARPPGYPINPYWAPDSKTIYYTVDSGAQFKILQVSVEGDDPKPILPEEKKALSDANPSPDGRKLVFAKAPAANFPPNPDTSISILDLDTGQETMLPGSRGKFSPRWSPDGRYISANSWDAKKLFLYDLKTQHWVEVDHADKLGWQLFSRDGRSLYYICKR
jgi:DNA-binding winged helix-turn-helix (wHTH) protein/Tol biopolymer transport system component